MHREMRRKDRQTTTEEARTLLQKAEYGVLATADKDGKPYGVPMSFALHDNTIYFHSAKSGHKLDNILAQPAVTFTVVGQTRPVVESSGYSTYFESAIAFGKAHIVTDEGEIRDALYTLTKKYFPDNMDFFETAISDLTRLVVFAVDVEHISGKAKKM